MDDTWTADRLALIAAEMEAEADNLCPFNDDGSGGDSHPAPSLRRWACRLRTIAGRPKS